MTHYHGVTIADAALFVGVSEQTVRQWLSRGQIPRSTDGQIDPFGLQEWAEVQRDRGKAKRTGIHRAGEPRYDRKHVLFSPGGS